VRNASYLSNRRGDRHPDGLKDLAADSPALAADGKTLAILCNGDFLKRLQILLDVGPFQEVARLLPAPIQFFAEQKSQEATEDMTSNRLIPLMVYGSGFQNGLHLLDGEALLQIGHGGEDRLDIGRIARPHGTADRPARGVDDGPCYHLLSLGTLLLGVAVLAQGLSSLSTEGEACGVEEDEGEAAEEVPVSVKELLFHPLPPAASLLPERPWRDRGGGDRDPRSPPGGNPSYAAAPFGRNRGRRAG